MNPKIQALAHQVTYNTRNRMEQFRAMPLDRRSAVFNVLSARVQREILKQLSLDEAVELLDHLDLRRAHKILNSVKEERQRTRIIKRLKNDLHAKTEQFLQFHPQARRQLLHLNYILLPEMKTVGEAALAIEEHLHSTGKVPEVLVSREGNVVGEVSLGTLVRARNTTKLAGHARAVKTLEYNAPRQDIVSALTTQPHKKVAILDTDGSVIGVVYSDDVIELLGEAPAATLYSFAGVEESERPFDSVGSKVKHRYKWLIINLATAFMAAMVVAFFEDTLTEIVILAAYMPVISGMGGNAATQTLAVVVRGIAIGEISLKNAKQAILREVGAGFVNGLITGALVVVVASIFNQNPLLGVVVGTAIVINLMISGIAGTIIPLILKSFGKDPATSATVFITTATDVLGFIIYLSLATLILY